MPLYEYECEKCGHRFEKIRKFSDPPLDTCPKCEGKVRKLLSAPAIQFKGQGWYITDYARKAKGESEKKEGKSSPEKASKDTQPSKSPGDKSSGKESS